MNKTLIYVIIAFIILLLILIVGFNFFVTRQDEGQEFARDRSFFETIFPFIGTQADRPLTTQDTDEETSTANQPAPILHQVTKRPVAGAVIITKKSEDEDMEVIRYVDQETGNFFEAETKTLNKARISNTTIPQVQKTTWSPDGSRVVLTFINENGGLENFSAKVPEEPDTQIDGAVLDTGIIHISTFDDELGYALSDDTGTHFLVSNYDGRAVREVFFTPLRELLVSWVQLYRITFSTKPSPDSLGVGFSVDTRVQVPQLVGGANLLSLLQSPDNFTVLSSSASADDNSLVLDVHDLSSGDITLLFFGTVVDKCAWSSVQDSIVFCAVPSFASGTLIDSWFKGLVSFSDDIWKIDVESLSSEKISVLSSEAGEEIDAIELMVSPSGDYLIFKNKLDSSLWSLRLVEESEETDEEMGNAEEVVE